MFARAVGPAELDRPAAVRIHEKPPHTKLFVHVPVVHTARPGFMRTSNPSTNRYARLRHKKKGLPWRMLGTCEDVDMADRATEAPWIGRIQLCVRVNTRAGVFV